MSGRDGRDGRRPPPGAGPVALPGGWGGRAATRGVMAALPAPRTGAGCEWAAAERGDGGEGEGEEEAPCEAQRAEGGEEKETVPQ